MSDRVHFKPSSDLSCASQTKRAQNVIVDETLPHGAIMITTTTHERRDEIRLRQEHTVESNGVKVTDVFEVTISRAERLIRQKESEVKEKFKAYPNRFDSEIKQMMERMKRDVDVRQELGDFVPIDKWTREFIEAQKAEFYDERELVMRAFVQGKLHRKPYYNWTSDEIQERYDAIKKNEGQALAAEFMAEIEEECEVPNFEAIGMKALGYRLELFALYANGSLPPNVNVTPLPGTFRIEHANNALGWNGASFDEAGYFLAQVGEFIHVPIRAAILCYCRQTRASTETLWEQTLHDLSLENAPPSFVTKDIKAGLEAKQLVARQKPLQDSEMPDFLLYKTYMHPTTGRLTCVKEHEDQDWLDLYQFVLQMDHLVQHCGAGPFLAEEEQEAYGRRRRYVQNVLIQMERDAGTFEVGGIIKTGQKRPNQ